MKTVALRTSLSDLESACGAKRVPGVFTVKPAHRRHANTDICLIELPPLIFFISKPGDLLLLGARRGAIRCQAGTQLLRSLLLPHLTLVLPLRTAESNQEWKTCLGPLCLKVSWVAVVPDICSHQAHCSCMWLSPSSVLVITQPAKSISLRLEFHHVKE